MYSLLMMAAMASSPDTTSFGWRFAGCTGCTGYASCYGSCYGSSCYGSSCYGSSCYGTSCFGSSCYGSSCYGSSCQGSSCHGGLFPRLRARMAGLGSCRGSCHGSSCYGSSCYGSSCHGASCHGAVHYGIGCYGSSCYGSASCYGTSCYGSTVNLPGLMGGCGGIIVGQAVPAAPVYGAVSEAPATVVAAKISEEANAPAQLILELPANAKLFVDNQLIAGEGASRSFHTPDLASGQTYYYDFKAVIEIDGQTQTEEKRVVVRAGDKLSESFPKLIAAAASLNRAPTVVVIK